MGLPSVALPTREPHTPDFLTGGFLVWLPSRESEGLDQHPLTPGLANGQPVPPTACGPMGRIFALDSGSHQAYALPPTAKAVGFRAVTAVRRGYGQDDENAYYRELECSHCGQSIAGSEVVACGGASEPGRHDPENRRPLRPVAFDSHVGWRLSYHIKTIIDHAVVRRPPRAQQKGGKTRAPYSARREEHVQNSEELERSIRVPTHQLSSIAILGKGIELSATVTRPGRSACRWSADGRRRPR